MISHEEVQTDRRHNEPVAHPAGVTETRVRQAHRRRRRARQGQGRVSTVCLSVCRSVSVCVCVCVCVHTRQGQGRVSTVFKGYLRGHCIVQKVEKLYIKVMTHSMFIFFKNVVCEKGGKTETK